VFGGATGAEVLIEVVRRAVSPADALAWLGGPDAYLAPGEAETLLSECALSENELDLVRSASGTAVGDLLERAGSQELATVLFALVELGVLRARTSSRKPQHQNRRRPPADVIDHDAVRARIRARRALVEEGDYFALLGVSRNATSYDIRRAYSTLRQEFEPSRILTPLTTDLQDDVDVIIDVLDEAYEILRDQIRRERYRRALEEPPEPDART
ncbi:MAG TPA: DnaJ domain-containing protein, partial [Polyangiaceae bacterium]